jgi:hypothetical protein
MSDLADSVSPAFERELHEFFGCSHRNCSYRN